MHGVKRLFSVRIIVFYFSEHEVKMVFNQLVFVSDVSGHEVTVPSSSMQLETKSMFLSYPAQVDKNLSVALL